MMPLIDESSSVARHQVVDRFSSIVAMLTSWKRQASISTMKVQTRCSITNRTTVEQKPKNIVAAWLYTIKSIIVCTIDNYHNLGMGILVCMDVHDNFNLCKGKETPTCLEQNKVNNLSVSEEQGPWRRIIWKKANDDPKKSRFQRSRTIFEKYI
jgi:hypothetical protein